MTVKEYLEQIRNLDNLINANIEEIARLRALATSISSPSCSGMPTGNSSSSDASFTRTIEKIILLENKLNDEIDKLVDLKEEIGNLINSIEDSELRLILQKRYLLNQTWDVIANCEGYSQKHIYKLHKKALNQIKWIPNDT